MPPKPAPAAAATVAPGAAAMAVAAAGLLLLVHTAAAQQAPAQPAAGELSQQSQPLVTPKIVGGKEAPPSR